MREITTTVFTYEELSESAKEAARDWFRGTGETWDSSDWWNSAQAWSGIAPIEIKSADYDRGQVDIRWTGDDDVAGLEGVRAWKWLQNNGWFDWAAKEKPGACSLTGFCADAPFADPLAEYATKPGRVPDLKQVFYECAQAWVFEARSDYESTFEDDYVAETIIANEYEFTEDGRRHD